MTILRITLLGVVLILAAMTIAAAAYIAGPEATRIIAMLGLFGVWSLLCVGLGAWGRHRREVGQAPLPTFSDATQMFNWIRTGKATGNPGDDPPPLDDDAPVTNFKL